MIAADRPALLGVLLLTFVTVDGWLAFRPGSSALEFRFGVYFLASAVASIDLIDLLVRLYLRRAGTVSTRARRVPPTSIPLDVYSFRPDQVRMHIRPWAIVASVYNLGAQTDEFVAGLGPFRDRLLVIDDGSTDDTWARLEGLGVRCFRDGVNRRKPGAIQKLLEQMAPDIRTVLVVDPDVRLIDSGIEPIYDLERVLFEFQRSGAAALCPRFTVRPDGWLARFQELEYAMALSLGRKSMADQCLTSGVALYRRDALADALSRHSLSVYAEDLRTALLLLSAGERIYYDGRLHFQTEGKRTVRALMSQRIGWFYGLALVLAENRRELWMAARQRALGMYHLVVYLGVLTVILHPIKLVGAGLLLLSLVSGVDLMLGSHLLPRSDLWLPGYFVLAYLKYLVFAFLALVCAVAPGQRARLAAVVPTYFVYALAQLLPATLGFLNYATVRWTGKRLVRDHFQDDASLADEQSRRRSS